MCASLYIGCFTAYNSHSRLFPCLRYLQPIFSSPYCKPARVFYRQAWMRQDDEKVRGRPLHCMLQPPPLWLIMMIKRPSRCRRGTPSRRTTACRCWCTTRRGAPSFWSGSSDPRYVPSSLLWDDLLIRLVLCCCCCRCGRPSRAAARRGTPPRPRLSRSWACERCRLPLIA